MNITIDVGAFTLGIAGAVTIANYMLMKYIKRAEQNMANLCRAVIENFNLMKEIDNARSAKTDNPN